ncbi:hypothetical protein SUGI_1023620 [Cryptomeria japonica]|nr:hypothetical protein SUGI_1023620 [Cryptomeria japonica]
MLRSLDQGDERGNEETVRDELPGELHHGIYVALERKGNQQSMSTHIHLFESPNSFSSTRGSPKELGHYKAARK